MWRNIIEYCRSDATSNMTSPQVLINHIAAVVAQESAPTISSFLGVHETTTDMPVSDDEFTDGAQQGSREADVDVDTISVVSEAGPGHYNMGDYCATDGEGDAQTSNRHQELFCDEGVVGGILSQWSLSGVDAEGSDDNGDILDCLEVDLDEM
ncbi:hypothetical protein H4R24_002508 [Coemansia sp. RSA 988]|nr:hypothetical protein H4R24_002508 [Coemansia sp. RSA 988]